jgi:hypothetical protein
MLKAERRSNLFSNLMASLKVGPSKLNQSLYHLKIMDCAYSGTFFGFA